MYGNVFWCLLWCSCIVINRRCHYSTSEVRISKMLLTTLMKEQVDMFYSLHSFWKLFLIPHPPGGFLSVPVCCYVFSCISETKLTPMTAFLFSSEHFENKYVVLLNFALKLLHIHILTVLGRYEHKHLTMPTVVCNLCLRRSDWPSSPRRGTALCK